MGTKMKRKLIATAVAVLTVLNYMIIPVSAAGTAVNAGTWTAIRNAVNNNSACEITLTADITLSTSDTAITINEGKDVTLDLNNHTIRRNCNNNSTTSNRFFDVSGDFTLVDNSTDGNGKITGAFGSRNNQVGIRVRSTGVFTMKSGTISNNAATRANGGAVYVDGGKFIMEGGTLDHNNAARGGQGGNGGAVYIGRVQTGGDYWSGFTYAYGSFEMKGGTIKNCGTKVYTEEYTNQGGAVYVYAGCEFIMSGGSIGTSDEGNSVTYDNNTVRGGAVYVAGTFTMTGGSLCNNKATGGTMCGQQVYVAGAGVFNLNGGTVEDTKSGDAIYVDNNATFNMGSGSITGCASGSAVYLSSNNSAFIMNGGTISGCKTADNGNGGAVNLYRGTFTMNGGTITENSASKGGGVYVADSANAKFNLYGGTITGNTGSGVYVDRNGVISVGKEDATDAINVTENTDSGLASNIYLYNASKTITVTGPIKEGSQIAVRFNNNATDITATSGYSTANADVDPATIFLADQEGYEVELYNDEVHYMIHDWQYDGFDWTGNDTDGYTAAAVKYVDGNNAAFTRSVDAELAVDTESNPATCTEGGKITYTASIAADKALDGTARSDVKEVNTLATGHDFGDWEPYDETQHKRVCAHNPAHVEYAAHSWNDGVITDEATCEEEGVKTYTCTVCGATKTEVIPAKGHTLTKTEANEETCTEPGNSEYWTCSECGKYFSDAEGKNPIEKDSWIIPATGHDYGEWTKLDDEQHQRVCSHNPAHVETAPHSWDDGSVLSAATCTEDGVKIYTCSICGATKTEVIEATGHDYGDWVPTDEFTHQRVCSHDPAHVEYADHSWDDGEITTPATCENAGVKTYTCSVCGGTKTEAIPATGHKGVKTEANEATCEEAGNSEYWTCSECGKYFSDEDCTQAIEKDSWIIPATGHAYGDWEPYDETQHKRVCANNPAHVEYAAHSWNDGVITDEATCEEEGVKTYTCTVCGVTKTEVIPAKGHTLTKTEANEETCTEPGNSEYWTCSECGKYFSDAEGKNPIEKDSWIIPAKGHTLTKTEANEATCEEAGNSEYWTCSECGKYFSDAEGKNPIEKDSWIIPAKGHTLTKTDAVPATCETAGNGEYWTCSVCGKHFSDAAGKTEISENAWIIPAGHTLVKVDAVDPTCEDNGNIEYWKCTACGKLFSDDKCTTEYEAEQVVLFAAHKPVPVAAIPATCTDFGYEAGTKCSVCGKTIDGCGKLPMLDHTPVEVPEEPATCTKAGTTAGSKCSVCGTVLEGCDPIEPLGHNWGDWKVTKPATVDAKGEETRTCSRCDASETRDIAKLTPAPGSDVTLKLDKSSMNVICGQTGTIKATVKGTTDKVTWKSSNTKIATVDANGKVTAKQAGSVTITATVAGKKATCKVQILYKDVTNTSEFWYAPTYYLTDKNVVKGYANQTEFRPANVCTRAQMVTFIWRLMGEPAPKAKTCKFNDVKETDYFYKACIWGNENHIVEGYKDGSFGPQITCARKHAVTFLWRLAGKPEPKTKENKFSDVKTKDYYYKATLWASETKILAGYDDGTFRPEGDCLRRQMVTFLYKYDKFVNAKKG